MRPQHTLPAQRPHVLVVDDDAALTKTLRRVLSSESLDVEVANDGLGGLAAARQRCPALVIVDLHMPRMDGIEFIDACRTIEGCSDVPIFLATGSSDVENVRSRLEGKGSVLLIPKPFDLETLVTAARDAILSPGLRTRTRARECEHGARADG
jgi:two-component system, OmpR family, response regulator MprA